MFFKVAGTTILFGTAMTMFASAQTITIAPNPGTFQNPAATLRTAPLHIQVNIQIASPLPSGDDDEIKLTEAARKKIYESTANECSILSEIFKADCKMISLNAASSIQNRGAAGQSVSANGNASYELVPRDK
jgi:hypothetical protein